MGNVFTLSLIVSLVACSSIPAPVPRPRTVRLAACEGPARSLSPEIRATLAPRTGTMMPDDLWAELATRVPGGFAGVMLSEKGTPLLMLTDTAKAVAARAALAPELAGKIFQFDVTKAEARAVRWDFAQLVDWFNYLMQKTSSGRMGMSTADKDEGINRIRFGVVDSVAMDGLATYLGGLDLPCDLVQIEVVGRIILLVRPETKQDVPRSPIALLEPNDLTRPNTR